MDSIAVNQCEFRNRPVWRVYADPTNYTGPLILMRTKGTCAGAGGDRSKGMAPGAARVTTGFSPLLLVVIISLYQPD